MIPFASPLGAPDRALTGVAVGPLRAASCQTHRSSLAAVLAGGGAFAVGRAADAGCA